MSSAYRAVKGFFLGRKKNNYDLGQMASALVADHQTQHISDATRLIFADADSLRKIAQQRALALPEIAQGWQFEQLEVIKFNMDAFKKGADLRAATTDVLGKTNHPEVDVIIKTGRKEIESFQLKSGNRAARTAHMLAHEKYADVKLVGPSDQHDKVKELYEKRIASGTLKAGDYERARQNLRREVGVGDISSGGTTYDEALKATSVDQAEIMANSFEYKAIGIEMHRSGMEAGKLGAGVSGGVSVVTGLIRLKKGEAGPGEVVASVAIDAAKGYATSYFTTSISKAMPHVLVKAGASEVISSALVKSNAHLAIAAGVVQSAKSLVKYAKGEITEQELLTEISGTAITGASSFYYAALGQAVIPVPILGAFIGATVGYMVGSMLHQSGLISLGETVGVQLARERRERIEELCMVSIPLMRAHRLELQRILDQNFAARSQNLTLAFDVMEKSMLVWDCDKFSEGLERVNNAFGASLPFKTFKEFDGFMKDDSQSFVL
jgi:hypothetical protein